MLKGIQTNTEVLVDQIEVVRDSLYSLWLDFFFFFFWAKVLGKIFGEFLYSQTKNFKNDRDVNTIILKF